MARQPRAATIADVAQHAGVSPATVSRIMNGRFVGAPAVAERVRASATHLQYSPNHLARSFALGKTKAIAFLVPDLANPAFQTVLAGLSKAAAADGYRVLVADSAESADDEPVLAAEVRSRCDAIVLCAPRMSEDDLERTTAALGPVVLMNRSSPRVTAPTLSVDSRAGFELIAQHLYSLGHRRLVYVAGPEGVANANRVKGLSEFAEDVGDVTITHVAGGAGSADGLAAVDAVIASGATAALAFNDLVAVGLVHGLVERGIRVPDDVSVTGFDDIPFARFLSPSLTTASVPHDVLGTLAWGRMQALMAGMPPEHNVVFQPRLEVRRSTAAPPAAE